MTSVRATLAALCLLACHGANAEEAIDIAALEAAAQRGDVGALLQLATQYERGKSVARDFAKSNDYYCKAAARGDAEALLKLGIVYSIGRGVMADEGVAALLIAKAAEHGNERAKELLEHVSARADSVLPACLDEPVAPAEEALSGVLPRKDIELLVQRWAPEYSLDPNLVLAVIAIESKFDPGAVSPKQARGLMQLIPATAERFGVKNAFDVLDNLKGGLAYLRWLMAYFKGNVALVLAAYNAGEDAVDKHRGVPPYAETREYVRRIANIYRKASHPYIAELVAPSSIVETIQHPGGRGKQVEEAPQVKRSGARPL